MTKIDPQLCETLRTRFLPKIEAMRRSRERSVWVFRCVSALMLLGSIVALIVVVCTNRDLSKAATLFGTAVPLSLLSFFYFAKLEACQAELLAIDVSIETGDAKALVKAIGKLGCFDKYRKLVDALQSVLKK